MRSDLFLKIGLAANGWLAYGAALTMMWFQGRPIAAIVFTAVFYGIAFTFLTDLIWSIPPEPQPTT